MTFRSALIGLLLGVGIAVFSYFNDWVMQQAFLATNLIPISVYGFLLIGVLLINPLLRCLGGRSLSSREWCVVASLMLVACVIPGPGLMWQFSNSLVMPFHANAVVPGWQKYNLIDYAPGVMLVDPGPRSEEHSNGKDYDAVVGWFKSGLPGQKVSFGQVPWYGWCKTLTFWLPLLGLGFIATICVVVVVHEQWSKRELLRYPVAYVTSELIRGPTADEPHSIFHNKCFWAGFAIPAVILLINGYGEWNTSSIRIDLKFWLEWALVAKWPVLRNLPQTWLLLAPEIFFSAIGFAYFVSSETSFSLGISNIVYGAAFLLLTKAGVDMTGGMFEGGNQGFQMFGSYLGLGLVILYTGRRFYLTVIAKALLAPTAETVERTVVWACRFALLVAAAMVVMLHLALGLDWSLAILFVLLVGLMLVVLTRINVETGLFMIQPGWYAVGVLLGAFGFSAIGPHMLIILGILCLVMTVDPIVCLMPLAANAVKLGETEKVRIGRLSRWMTVSVLLAMVTGVLGTIAVQYAFGGSDRYGWADDTARMPFEMLERNLQNFPSDPSQRQGFDFGKIEPKGSFLWSTAIGMGIVLLLSALRLRYHWWPIHPVLFLVWGTFPGLTLAPSFLLGWLLKTVVTGLGGGQAYRNFRPFFIGLIAGEFAAAVFWSIVGIVYFLVRHVPGPAFRVFPA